MVDTTNDLMIVFGMIPSLDNQEILHVIKQKAKEGTKIVLLATMEDLNLSEEVALFCKYEVGSEEGVVALLAKYVLQNKEISQEMDDFFEHLDEGYISAESNISEEEFEEITNMLQDAKSVRMIIGEDLVLHPCSKNINCFLSLIKQHTFIQLETFDFCELPEQIEELKSFDGTVVMRYCETDIQKIGLLFGSTQFSLAAKVKHDDEIVIDFGMDKESRKFVLNRNLKGTIALMPVDEANSSYRYKVAKITKREVQ